MVNFVCGLNRDLIDIIFDRVDTDGNIYRLCTLPALQEIALWAYIGLIEDIGDEKVYPLFVPAIERAIRDLQKEGRTGADKGDYSLHNELCFNKLHKDYYAELGKMLYEHYKEHILYILKNEQF